MKPPSLQFPRYVQVERQMREMIESGTYRPGDRLPDERELSVQWKVSRGTVRQALGRLTQQGLIKRYQGRGTFVAQRAITSGYICVVAVGPTARLTYHNAVAIAETERHAAAHGLHVSVRYCDDAAHLQKAIVECEQEETVTAGLILGVVPECPLDAWMANAHKPWVLMADFNLERRGLPPMHQVVSDWYAAFEAATQDLVERGSRRPALFVLTASVVWSADRISAFRAVCDTAGIEPRWQQVHDLHRYRRQPLPSDAYRSAVRHALDDVFDEWRRNDTWPDGVIFPVSLCETWNDALRDHPDAARALEGKPLTLWTIDDNLPPRRMSGPVTYLHLSVGAMVKQAIERLLENHNDDMPLRRDYVCAHRLIPDKSAAVPDPAQIDAV